MFDRLRNSRAQKGNKEDFFIVYPLNLTSVFLSVEPHSKNEISITSRHNASKQGRLLCSNSNSGLIFKYRSHGSEVAELLGNSSQAQAARSSNRKLVSFVNSEACRKIIKKYQNGEDMKKKDETDC